jgi:hypothetical protein
VRKKMDGKIDVIKFMFMVFDIKTHKEMDDNE